MLYDAVPYAAAAARGILLIAEALTQRMSGLTVTGRVKIGVVEDFAASRLIEILKGFRDRNPQIEMG